MEENKKELDLEEMEQVTGGEGEDAGGCPHAHVKRRVKYDITPGKNDWGQHVSRYYIFECKDCGQQWNSKDANFMKWQK